MPAFQVRNPQLEQLLRLLRAELYQGGRMGQLLQVTHYINDTLEQTIKLADLARLTGMSQSHFSRLFKQSTGSSPHQYLLQQRIERAKCSAPCS